eukprot:s168_g50.t1
MVDSSDAMQSRIQHLLDECFVMKSTRDRGGKMPCRLVVEMVQRLEHHALWKRYVDKRRMIQLKRGEVTAVEDMAGSGACKTTKALGGLNQRLESEVNELYLFHGSCPAGASSKCDEYAREDPSGLFSGKCALLLCRVSCGELFRLEESDLTAIQRAMATGRYDGVLGDREQAAGTYREFVVYDEAQVYPEYIIIYRREFKDPRSVSFPIVTRGRARLLAHLAIELMGAEAGSHEKTLQAAVTSLARLMRDHEVEPVAGSASMGQLTGRRGRAWTLLRHVVRACWALQRGLEALCCVCLEASPKSLGLLCARPHGVYQLLCGDCLEPYVCSLIGTAELRRYEGILCPACACADGEGTIFSRAEVQAKLQGPALRRFVEATDPVDAGDPVEEETGEDEFAVLVEDLVSRSVRLVTHARVSENDEPREVRRSKEVLPHTWLLCDGEAEYFQYDPQQMRLRQHMSPRLFQLQVAECLTMHCPKCHCPLDPDPDGCVAMSCMACNEGFCWVCFTCCGDDAHQHALETHGGYFPGQEFVQAWHRKLRWERVQLILRQLLEESQNDALEGSKGLLEDLNLWPFPSESPDVPDCADQVLNVHGEPWGPINLHLAARLGRMEELREALEEEDVNLQDERGMTALCYASHEGRMEAIRLLMDRAADPNLADFHGVTPLHYACREPPFAIQEDVAGFLLSFPQVDANQRDDTGASAILVAAEVGRHQVMPSLLACERLDPNLTNLAGRTALLVACGFDHTEVVMHLLRSERVHVTLRGQHGETPLHMAALRGGVEVLQLLLAHPQTELNAVNDVGRSALHEAASLGAHQVVQCLLRANVLVDQRDKKGCSPLMLAAMNGSFEAFEALLPLSHDLVNDRDSEGFTVLMRLAARGAIKGLMAHACLQLLRLESGVDIDAQNAEGSTALMLAIGNGCVPSAEDLLVAQGLGDRGMLGDRKG